jgi:hypothetical protein
MLSELVNWDGRQWPGMVVMIGLAVAVLLLLRWYFKSRSGLRSIQERERLRKDFWGWG